MLRKTLFFSSPIGLRRELRRRLHRGEGEDLEEVRDDHVAEGARGLVEGGASREPKRLGHVDLNVVDEVPVPDRLEEPVREAEGQDVLGRLLAQEVVDPKNLLLVEDGMQVAVERRPQLSRSVPKGFSITIRERSTRSGFADQSRTAESAAEGGTLR